MSYGANFGKFQQNFGRILAEFWQNFGTMLKECWQYFYSWAFQVLKSIGIGFGSERKRAWSHFGIVLVEF